MTTTTAIILAAGKGTRMRSALPKVLQPLAGKPILQHIVDAVEQANIDQKIIVCGHEAELVKQTINAEHLQWVYQAEQLGTGHAVDCAMPSVTGDKVIVLVGDALLITADTLSRLIAQCPEQGMSLLTAIAPDPTGLGRIIRHQDGSVCSIIEHKDASETELCINEINTGIMCLSRNVLEEYLPKLRSDNAQGELYLTDVIGLCAQDEVVINAVTADFNETMGVNDKQQLAKAERIYQQLQVERLMQQGCTVIDPSRLDVRGIVDIGMDVLIDVNVVLEGQVSIGNGVIIEPNCVLKNCKIADNVHIKAFSHLEEATVGDSAIIGPYARLRPGTVLEKDVRVGNFVEIKKSQIDEGAKINHLSYVGDAEVGKNANIGAGTITCNYDGVNKFKTQIGEGAFIGSNSSLIAPVTIGENAVTGAGSAIAKDVPASALGIARAKQRNIEGWKK